MKTANSYARITLCFVAMLLSVAGFVRNGVAVENKSNRPPLISRDAAQQSTAKRVYESGVCEVLNLGKSSQRDVYPVSDANMYFSFNPDNWQIDAATAIITILQQPKNGRLEPTYGDGNWNYARYLPNDGYTGDDSYVIQVEGNGYTVKLHYFLNINVGIKFNPNPVCKGVQWKISQDPNDKSLVGRVTPADAIQQTAGVTRPTNKDAAL